MISLNHYNFNQPIHLFRDMKSTKQSIDFKALELKENEDSVSPHTIFFKEHSVREHTPDKPPGRTLFIVNLPPYVNENGLKNAFSEAGAITSIIFKTKLNENETTVQRKFIPDYPKVLFRIAYLVFAKVVHLHKALKLEKLKPLNCNDSKIKVGIEKWIESYNNSVITSKVLKEKVETFMKSFDKEMKKIEKDNKEVEQEDEEGWITVTKKGKVNSFPRSEMVENKIMAKEESNKKRKELQNFYTFQIRESKMKHIVALRKKFEEDKQKIAKIKQGRRFKPF